MKITRRQLREIIQEQTSDDMSNPARKMGAVPSDHGQTLYTDGPAPNLPDDLRRALESKNEHLASKLMSDMQSEELPSPSIEEVARALGDGFILDASGIDGGSLPMDTEGLKFYAVIRGQLVLIGNTNLDNGIFMSKGEHAVVVYPGSLEDFNL